MPTATIPLPGGIVYKTRGFCYFFLVQPAVPRIPLLIKCQSRLSTHMKGRKEMLDMLMVDYKKDKIWQGRLFHQSTYRTLPHLRQKVGHCKKLFLYDKWVSLRKNTHAIWFRKNMNYSWGFVENSGTCRCCGFFSLALIKQTSFPSIWLIFVSQ